MSTTYRELAGEPVASAARKFPTWRSGPDRPGWPNKSYVVASYDRNQAAFCRFPWLPIAGAAGGHGAVQTDVSCPPRSQRPGHADGPNGGGRKTSCSVLRGLCAIRVQTQAPKRPRGQPYCSVPYALAVQRSCTLQNARPQRVQRSYQARLAAAAMQSRPTAQRTLVAVCTARAAPRRGQSRTRAEAPFGASARAGYRSTLPCRVRWPSAASRRRSLGFGFRLP